MRTEIDFFLIVFVILMGIITIYFPISGHFATRKLKKSIAAGDSSEKIKFYRDTVIWLWIPFFLVALLIPISAVSLNDLGVKWIDFDEANLPGWVVYLTIGFYLVYLLYNVYSIVIFKISAKSRERVAKSIAEKLRWIFPISQNEKRLWSFMSVSAGITEEVVYRGYLFYALSLLFPSLSILYILLISTLIFGIAHIYLGKEALRSTLLGLIFGFFYIVFDSIIPVIIIHIAQDLVLRDIFEDKAEEATST